MQKHKNMHWQIIQWKSSPSINLSYSSIVEVPGDNVNCTCNRFTVTASLTQALSYMTTTMQ